MKRTGVFVFSDIDGKADRYVEYILSSIREELDFLLTVINGKADDKATALFKNYSDDVVNTDSITSSKKSAYYKGIAYLSSNNLIDGCRELVLLSNEFYGPFLPFKQILEAANAEETKKDIQSLSGYLSASNELVLDNWFLLIRENVLHSFEFMNYWNNDNSHDNMDDLVKYFSRKNYSCGTIYDTLSYDSIQNTIYNPLYLLKNGFPVIAADAIKGSYSDVVSKTLTTDLGQCLKYVKDNYQYDTDYIYENIIRCSEPYELLTRFNNNYVLPENYSLGNVSTDTFKSTVIVFHLYYEQLFDLSLSYLDNVPEGVDVIITTTSDEKAAAINEKIRNYSYLAKHSRVIVSIGNGRDMAGLLVEAREFLADYKYICFTHDKMSVHHKRTSGEAFARTIIENVIYSKEYISNVISVFEQNEKVGLLVPPPPEHEAYFAVIGRKWTGNYSYFVKLCEKIGMPVNCTKDSVAFALGTSFWCRYDALKTLFEYNWSHSDFPDEPLPLDGSISHAIERCFPFVAQYNGYLCGTIHTTAFASMLLNNREYMLTDLLKTINENVGTDKQTLNSLREKLEDFFISYCQPDFLKKRADGIRSDIKIIKKSKFFDKNRYVKTYSDVCQSDMSPQEHYLLVGWRKGYDPSEKFSTTEYLKLNSDVADRNINPLVHYHRHGYAENRKYKLDTGDYRERRLYHSIKRSLGKLFYKNQIIKNKDKRILVMLHMFYMCSWIEIKEYLKNLEVYNYDLIVTYTDVTRNEAVLEKIRQFKPGVKLVECPNVGYDVGPFLHALNDVNLDEYDIVFKLQSKGVNRARCYIYGQYFKKRDWFLNLYEGCIGEFTVHKTIDYLSGDNNVGIVAAENLILKDPTHKQNMVKKYMKEKGITIPEEYLFVSGTCFAERASLLKTVQNMHYDISEFQAASSGFSTAHKLERIICLTILNDGYSFKGNKVMSFMRAFRKLDPDYIKRKRYSGIRIANDKRFNFDDEFVYFCLENQLYKKYELTEIPLSDIKRKWLDSIIPINQCHPYLYLVTGDPKVYQEYCMLNQRYYKLNIMSVDRFDSLMKSIDESGYDENSFVVVNQDNILKDGQHRCCYMMYKYGEDYKIPVVKCYEYNGMGIKLMIKMFLKKVLSDKNYNSIVKLYRKVRFGE